MPTRSAPGSAKSPTGRGLLASRRVSGARCSSCSRRSRPTRGPRSSWGRGKGRGLRPAPPVSQPRPTLFLAAALWIEDVRRWRHVRWPGQLRCPDRLTLQPHPLGLRFRLGIHWRTKPGEHLLDGIHVKHPTPADRVGGLPARPRGRRSVDLAGPPVRDLPASNGARNVTGESDAFRRKSNTGRFTARTGAITRSAARG